MTQPHRLATPERIRDFALGGNARVTLVSQKTGVRITYRIKSKEGSDIYFVSVLTGADNEGDYSFLGTIFPDRRFVHSRKSSIDRDAPSARAFVYAWPFMATGADVPHVEVWHEGRCGVCGRPLTVPESIESGIGPVCASRPPTGVAM